MRRISPDDEAGFTLIEVMMSLLILTVGLLGLLQSIQVAYQHNAANRMREEAVLLAEEQMNVLKDSLKERSSFNQFTTVKRVVAGVDKPFVVQRESTRIGDSERLTVVVRWVFKNMSSQHELYSIRRI